MTSMEFPFTYAWGNNPKRSTLKGKRCKVLAYGKKNSVMVEFENGQQEITSRYAVKEVASMAGPERKSYRSAAPTPPAELEEEVYEDEEVQEEAPPIRRAAPARAVPPSRGPAPSRPSSRPSGGGNYGRGGQSQDGTYVTVTGLFPTKSGKADTAFVKDDMYELLQGIKPGDTIGVSLNAKTNRLQLWYITKG